MNRHRLTYIDMYPQPLEREPSPLAIVAGAALALIALWVITAPPGNRGHRNREGSTMNRHRQTYTEIYPAEREPSPLAIVAGAALALIALWVITVFLFSL